MRLWPILGLLTACGSVGNRPPAVTIASTLQKPTLTLPSPDVVEDARIAKLLDEAIADVDAGRGREASAALLSIVCGRASVTEAELRACPRARSADVATGWALVGHLAFEGSLELKRNNSTLLNPLDNPDIQGASHDQLPIAEMAYERALSVAPSRMPRAFVLYKLAWSRYRLEHFDAALATFLETLDAVRTTPHRPGDPSRRSGGASLDLRDEALEYAAICVAETDWNGDGQDDAVRGFDRLEVKARLNKDTPDMPDLYARVVSVLHDQVECSDAKAALAAMSSRFPNDPRLVELTHAHAVTCP